MSAGTGTAFAAARTVGDWLALRRAATPHGEAFRIETAAGSWAAITWHAFATRVIAVQRGLVAAGLVRGDRLALVLPVGLEWELLHHAALGIGVVVVGLDSHDLPERLAAMAAQARIDAFAFADPAPWRRIRAAAGGDALGAPLLLSISAGVPAGDGRWLTLTALEAAPESAAALPRPAPTDPATIIFTSGTTGAPKGIEYSHEQLCLAVDAIADAFGFAGAGSHLLCWLPLSNLFQRVVNLAGLRQGSVTYLLADPRRVMDVVASVEPDVFVGVPRFFEKLHDGILARIAAQPPLQRRLAAWAWDIGRRASALERAGRPLPPALALARRIADAAVLGRIRRTMGTRLRCMVTGSAPMPRSLLEEFHALGWLVLEAYGLSENVLPMALNRLDAWRFGSVGRPLPGNDIVIDAAGQVRVRGPGLFGGYIGGSTGEQLDAAGYYATGDLGSIDADGYLRLTGRSNEMIKTSTGRRIAPVGVEARLQTVPGIDQAMLLGAGRKALVALCTLADPAADAAARAAVEQRLREVTAAVNEHERPLAIALLREPFSIEHGELTPNLKLRRAAIEARHAATIDALYRRLDEPSAPRGLVVV